MASVDRVVVSRSKYPMLYPAARKASWGGLWPASEVPYLRLAKPELSSREDEMERWADAMRDAGWSLEDITIAAAEDGEGYAEKYGDQWEDDEVNEDDDLFEECGAMDGEADDDAFDDLEREFGHLEESVKKWGGAEEANDDDYDDCDYDDDDDDAAAANDGSGDDESWASLDSKFDDLMKKAAEAAKKGPRP